MLDNTKRILLDVLLGLSLFLFPWWMSMFLMVVGVFVFPAYYEVLLAAVVLDALYGTRQSSLLLSNPFLLSSSIIFLLSFWIKEHITLQNRM